MLEFWRRDLVFLHAPAVFDFRRRRPLLSGPVNDVVPSSSAFEMYPVGITSIADQLERAGYHVQVINVAYRMLRDPDYDPERDIRRANPRLWAIDLHWLPHAQGALTLAAMVKKHHPDAKVLMGGLSASYYHRELIRDPNVDFVVRGDSAERPVLDLVERLRRGASLTDVPNLTWKAERHRVVVNPLRWVPPDLDHDEVPAYRYAMRSVFKYWNLQNIVPYLRWLDYPMTALLTARGCRQDCSICGGSASAYRLICGRDRPAVRSPERLIADIRFIRRFSRAPIFVIHDLRMHGKPYVDQLLSLLERERIDNEMVYELFEPDADSYLERLARATPSFSLELTLESHDPELRRRNGKFPVENDRVEETIGAALRAGCHRLDVFFMVGIPGQDRASALRSVDYARHLLERFGDDGRLQVYVAPLAPFLDPGSLAFESASDYGYRLRAHTLAEHRDRLSADTWEGVLNYESAALPQHQLVDTTYEAMARLIEAKRDLGRLEAGQAARRLELVRAAQDLMAAARNHTDADGSAAIAPVASQRAQMESLTSCRVYDQTDFVSWGRRRRQFRSLGLAVLMLELFFEELRHAWLRWRRKCYRWSSARSLATNPAASAVLSFPPRG